MTWTIEQYFTAESIAGRASAYRGTHRAGLWRRLLRRTGAAS